MDRVEYIHPQCQQICLDPLALLCVSMLFEIDDPEFGYGDPSIE